MLNLFQAQTIDYQTYIGHNKINYLQAYRGEIFAGVGGDMEEVQISVNGRVDMKWFNTSQKEYQKESRKLMLKKARSWKKREMACWDGEHKVGRRRSVTKAGSVTLVKVAKSQ